MDFTLFGKPNIIGCRSWFKISIFEIMSPMKSPLATFDIWSLFCVCETYLVSDSFLKRILSFLKGF